MTLIVTLPQQCRSVNLVSHSSTSHTCTSQHVTQPRRVRTSFPPVVQMHPAFAATSYPSSWSCLARSWNKRVQRTRSASDRCSKVVLFCPLPSARHQISDMPCNALLQLNFCVGDLRKQPKVHRERLLQQVRVRKRMDRIVECSRKLRKTYDDADGARKDEMTMMMGDKAFKVNACSK